MSKTDIQINRITADFKKAREKFELYEKFYLGLSENAKEYLRSQSREYKNILSDIQKIILPSIMSNCPTCIYNCCKLHTPELSIYVAGSLGCFDYVDYLLVRCDTILPNPYYENAQNNLCPFWSDGCILPVDCRSFYCIKYFCDKLKEELDMQLISKYFKKIKNIISNFSTRVCMV